MLVFGWIAWDCGLGRILRGMRGKRRVFIKGTYGLRDGSYMRRNRKAAALFGIVFLLICSTAVMAGPTGVVHLDGRTLIDNDGPFLGCGATYMQALRHCKYDRSRLEKELSFLAACGFNYVRVISMVDWPGQEISPVEHTNRHGQVIAAWPDYDTQLADLVAIAHLHGLRTQVTVFADAQYIMPGLEARFGHVHRLLKILGGAEEKVILYEVANEGWQNGFAGEEGIDGLRALGEEFSRHSGSLVALSSPPDAGDREEGIRRLYSGSRATIATVHFSRDLRTAAGSWLPVTDCWGLSQSRDLPAISSNEPIGPGASVASEENPEMIFSAAVFAYLAGLPMYVFHSAAGVSAEQSFETMPWLRQMGSVLDLLPRDLPNWERFDSDDDRNPVTALAQGVGLLNNCGSRKGADFIILAHGVDASGGTYRANASVSFSVYALMPAGEIMHETAARGATFMLKAATGTCLIKGRIQP